MTRTTPAILACAAALMLAGAPQASAQTIQLDLNNGRVGVAPTPDPYETRRGPVIIERERVGITCGEGRQIVRESGYRNVRPVRCGGRTFTYSAVRAGEQVAVRVSALDGRIVDVELY